MIVINSDKMERSKNNEQVVNAAPRVMRSKDLKWVRTRQDYKAALMIAPELGFPTGGSCLMRAEIPVGWHTGKHFYGEEAIYVESGEGFMVLDDQRYDFFPGNGFSHSLPLTPSVVQHGQSSGRLSLGISLASGSRYVHGQNGAVGGLRGERPQGTGAVSQGRVPVLAGGWAADLDAPEAA